MTNKTTKIIQSFFVFSLILALSSCASFDKTNILPGQRVPALGFSFKVPSNNAWFAVQYGNSNLIHLSQINRDDSYSIRVTLNRGPHRGMYSSIEKHLRAFKRSKLMTTAEKGLRIGFNEIQPRPELGKLCVQQIIRGENWVGRNNTGPAIIDRINLACAHHTIDNVIVSFEITRRAETYAEKIDMTEMAEKVFRSISYE